MAGQSVGNDFVYRRVRLREAKSRSMTFILYDLAQVRIWPYDKADNDPTVEVLEQLRDEFPTLPIKLGWSFLSPSAQGQDSSTRTEYLTHALTWLQS